MNIKKQSLNFAITNNDVTNNGMNDNTIVDIPINKIKEISEQPFIIHEDTINTLVDSIKRNGQLDPCIVTQSKDNSDMYDLLAGRHRKRACELAGLKTCKCIIRNNLSDDEKELIIIDTNTERNNDYLPSELAFAFKRKEELLSKTTNSAIKVIANESNMSRKKDETINEININSDGTYISFSSKNYNKFISLVNIYDLIREYIKNNYDITQIVEAYNYLH